jgi:YHS domain-containing protein
MPGINDLSSRIDAEFSNVEQKIKKAQEQQVSAHKERQQRLERLTGVFEELQGIWRPRLDLLMNKFKGRVQATPRVTPSSREGTLQFESQLARVRLRLSAYTDRDIQKLILSYDLEIVPVLMRFKQHDEAEFPLDRIDKDAVAKWVDDRIVDFVQTYFAMGENEIYLKDQMVEDPIAHVRFPKVAAAATLERNGKTFYFIGEDTRREFEKQQGVGSK